MTAQKIAYIVNQYPKGSHSFIRREIHALERQGVAIERISLRGWDAQLPDPQDAEEREKTAYVLKAGALRLLGSAVLWAMRKPNRFREALRLAVQMRKDSYRPLPYHLIYFLEACVAADWIERADAAHIHAHFGTNSAEVAMLAGILSARPYSFTAHGANETDAPIAIGLPEKIRRASFVVAVSYFVRSQMYRFVEYQQWAKIDVVRCGLEKAFYETSNETATSRNMRRFVCVGRLSAEKGQLLLLAAFRQVLDAGEDCELMLVGDGEMRGEVEQQIKALRLNQNVEITGWVSSSDVRHEILSSRALILSSFTEGLPVVLMEAMALRRPVLATHISGVPELVTSGETGWLFPAGDVAAMSRAIRACLAAADDELEEMGARAYTKVTAQHDIDCEAARLKALFAQHSADRASLPIRETVSTVRPSHRSS
jgi:glycosyltransferase involved in cell wall biosynthesis